MKTPRGMKAAYMPRASSGEFLGAETYGDRIWVSWQDGGERFTKGFGRADFDRLVDWYIGTPAIRAALKAKDEEILRLRAALMGNSVTRGTIHFYGPGE